MKIIVCSIMKDEPHSFVTRWYESAGDADELVILDTGSTNGCDVWAESLGITVHRQVFNPWRFDVARNHLLGLLPDCDYVINLDMDEVLVAGWRSHFDGLHADVTRPRYSYTWSWNDDGTPGLVYQGDKIHSRHGYEWRSPVHEALYPLGEEIQLFVEGLEIHHHPDASKSRGQYLPLLLISVEEDPDNDRNVYYCARELYFNGQFEAAIRLFEQHIVMPTAQWPAERAWSMRYLAKMLPDRREEWLLRAVEECRVRETLLDLAKHYYDVEDWANCWKYAKECCAITDKPMVYLNEAEAWGYMPWDLAAISAHHLGMVNYAMTYGQQAIRLAPEDERLQSNLHFYLKKWEECATLIEEGFNTHEGVNK